MKAFEEFIKEFEEKFNNLIKSTPHGVLISGATGSISLNSGATSSLMTKKSRFNVSGSTGSVGFVGHIGATGSTGITKQDFREIKLDDILFGPSV